MQQQKSFLIGKILQRAWSATATTKSAIWAPAILSIILSFIIGFIITAVFQHTLLRGDPTSIHPMTIFIVQLINAFIIAIIVAPFITGMLMVAIARARSETVSTQLGFKFTPWWLKLACINIIITIFAMVIDLFFSVIMALIIPAGAQYSKASMSHAVIGSGFVIVVAIIMFLCYLVFYAFMVFAMPIAIDKKKSPWDAITAACGAVQPHWLKMLGIEIIVTVVMVITLIPFSLGIYSMTTWVPVLCGVISLVILVWSLPFIILIHGEAYTSLIDQ